MIAPLAQQPRALPGFGVDQAVLAVVLETLEGVVALVAVTLMAQVAPAVVAELKMAETTEAMVYKNAAK
ncbi:hypothetical protein DCO48_20995 [Pseudomonas sp. SDI]|nr:hypothetical protein DCO48_20995 [Pseudomonas sp. SDI]